MATREAVPIPIIVNAGQYIAKDVANAKLAVEWPDGNDASFGSLPNMFTPLSVKNGLSLRSHNLSPCTTPWLNINAAIACHPALFVALLPNNIIIKTRLSVKKALPMLVMRSIIASSGRHLRR